MKKLRIRWNARSVDEFLTQQGAGIAEDHIFLPTHQPLEPGEQVRFELVLADGRPFLSGTAMVAGDRADAEGRPGMLLWFEALDRGHTEILARLRREVGDGSTLPRGSVWGAGADEPWHEEEDTKPEARPAGLLSDLGDLGDPEDLGDSGDGSRSR